MATPEPGPVGPAPDDDVLLGVPLDDDGVVRAGGEELEELGADATL